MVCYVTNETKTERHKLYQIVVCQQTWLRMGLETMLNLLLVRSHQAEIIIAKRLIQGATMCEMRVGVEP